MVPFDNGSLIITIVGFNNGAIIVIEQSELRLASLNENSSAYRAMYPKPVGDIIYTLHIFIYTCGIYNIYDTYIYIHLLPSVGVNHPRQSNFHVKESCRGPVEILISGLLNFFFFHSARKTRCEGLGVGEGWGGERASRTMTFVFEPRAPTE